MIPTKELTENDGEVRPVTGCTTEIGIQFYDKKTFSKKFGISTKTIERRIQYFKNQRGSWRYVQGLDKHYVSCGIIGFKRKELRYFKNEDYSQFLRVYDWHLAGTVRSTICSTAMLARKRMEGLFKALTQRYPNRQILFFYVTEENPGKDGFHNHFVLSVNDGDIKTIVAWMKGYINNISRGQTKFEKTTDTLLEEYRIKENWIEYMVKQMHKLPEAYNWKDHGLPI